MNKFGQATEFAFKLIINNHRSQNEKIVKRQLAVVTYYMTRYGSAYFLFSVLIPTNRLTYSIYLPRFQPRNEKEVFWFFIVQAGENKEK